LPRTANPTDPKDDDSLTIPGTVACDAEGVVDRVPVPQPAPQPKVGEAPAGKPTSIAGLLGNVFGGAETPAEVSPPAASEPVVLRGSKPETAKSRTATRTAVANAAPAPKAHNKPPVAAPAPPRLAAASEPVPVKPRTAKPSVADDAAPGSPVPQMRTAFSAPPVSGGALLTGAQPVVPVGSFDSRWSGVRN
jgi:hypothetical protein